MSNRVARVAGDGVELAVYERGRADGPTLLLVHGYPDTHAVWDKVVPRLMDRYRVVTYDVRGAGASTRPHGTEAYRFEHLMNDMRAVLDEVSPDRPVHLVGHDWGSIQSWEAVTTMAERFASYTSISGPCLDHAGHWSRTARPGARVRQALSSWYIGYFQIPVLPELGWWPPLAAYRLIRAVGGLGIGHWGPTTPRDGLAGLGLYRANMLDRLRHPRERRTNVPTQIVIPDGDLFVTPALAEESAIPFVPDLWVQHIGARHWAPVSHPDLIARLIDNRVTGTTEASPNMTEASQDTTEPSPKRTR